MTTGSAIETTRYLKFLAEEMVKVNLKISALSDWLRCKHPHDKDLKDLLHQFPRSAVFVPQLLTDAGIWIGDSGRPASASNRRDKRQEQEADSEAGDINENCDGEYDQDSSSQSGSEHDGSNSEFDSSTYTSTSGSNEENDMKQRLADLKAKGPHLARRSIPFPKKPKNVQKKNRGCGETSQFIDANTDSSPKNHNKSNSSVEKREFSDLRHEVLVEQQQGPENCGLFVAGRNSGEQQHQYETNFDVVNEAGVKKNTNDENLYEGNDAASSSTSSSGSKSFGSRYSWSSDSNSDENKDVKLAVPDIDLDANVGDLKLDKVKDENSGEYSGKTFTENHVGTEDKTEEADPETGLNTRQKQTNCGLKTLSDRTAGFEAEMRPCNVKLTRMTQEFINRSKQSGTSGVKRKRRKNMKCGYCSKEWKRFGDLLRHEFIHTGQKPFPCKVCGKSFRQKGHLVSHHKIHTGEKPFVCKMCRKCFGHKHVLEAHLRVHTGERPFACTGCSRRFTFKYSLKYHQTRNCPKIAA